MHGIWIKTPKQQSTYMPHFVLQRVMSPPNSSPGLADHLRTSARPPAAQTSTHSETWSTPCSPITYSLCPGAGLCACARAISATRPTQQRLVLEPWLRLYSCLISLWNGKVRIGPSFLQNALSTSLPRWKVELIR